ncbi:hypothetical protein BB561_005652 [Smittium simulii]|uniref:CHCH domain-containing protein n=1 Tax=Smittium simulii TaxID=133385 RepID=A0A2T9Y996_9FUNG|nr:hypothetical protein BB561_005652 [Smittium simulii]
MGFSLEEYIKTLEKQQSDTQDTQTNTQDTQDTQTNTQDTQTAGLKKAIVSVKAKDLYESGKEQCQDAELNYLECLRSPPSLQQRLLGCSELKRQYQKCMRLEKQTQECL